MRHPKVVKKFMNWFRDRTGMLNILSRKKYYKKILYGTHEITFCIDFCYPMFWLLADFLNMLILFSWAQIYLYIAKCI